MAATTRWVEYSIDAEGFAGTGGGTVEGVGTRGYNRADAATDKDAFTIGTGNNQLHVSIDSESPTPYITLASGTDLDPRFVARDITEKLHIIRTGNTGYDQAQCVWENNKFKIYSGSLGSGSSVVVSSGTNTAHLELGWGSSLPVGGTNLNPATGSLNNYDSGGSGITVSGTYTGFFDETYTVVINREYNIGTPVQGGSNTYTGTMTVGGVFNHTVDITYTIYIDAEDGRTTMGGGTGNVPKMSWISSTGTDDSSADVELLYPDYWYKVGTKGLMVKFSDAVFSHNVSPNAAYTIACLHPLYTDNTNTQNTAGNALYIWGSSRGEYSASAIATSESSFTRLGTRGLYIKFTGSGHTFYAGDQFTVVATPPQPKSYNITNLNYGNVTVSTESPVKAVIFEIMSGAIEMSTVKFGLQSHGSFSHHDANNDDTFFRFGTVGPGQPAGTSPMDGLEWQSNILASDINDDVSPAYLHATKGNLAVVSDADDSETIGASSFMGMVSDPIWLNIKLGTSEVGANSTINYRIYFDYS